MNALLAYLLTVLACSVTVHAQGPGVDFFQVPDPLIQCADVTLNWTARQPPYTIEVRLPVKMKADSPGQAWVNLFQLGPFPNASAQWTVNVSAETNIMLVCADANSTHLTASRTIAPGNSSCLPAKTTSASSDAKKENGPSGATVAGALGGSLLGVGITGLVWFCCWRRQRRRAREKSEGDQYQDSESQEDVQSADAASRGGNGRHNSCGTGVETIPSHSPHVALQPDSFTTSSSAAKEELMAAQQIKAVAAITGAHTQPEPSPMPTEMTTPSRDVDAGPLLPPAYDPQWNAPPAADGVPR